MECDRSEVTHRIQEGHHGRLAAISPFPANQSLHTPSALANTSEGVWSQGLGKGKASSRTMPPMPQFSSVPDPIPRDEVEVPRTLETPRRLKVVRHGTSSQNPEEAVAR